MNKPALLSAAQAERDRLRWQGAQRGDCSFKTCINIGGADFDGICWFTAGGDGQPCDISVELTGYAHHFPVPMQSGIFVWPDELAGYVYDQLHDQAARILRDMPSREYDNQGGL